MLRDVTLGRYYQAQSLLHSLDPRTKLAMLVLYIVSISLIKTPAGCILSFAFLLVMLLLSKVPLSYMLRGLGSVVIVVLIVDIIDLVFANSSLWKIVLITLRMVELVLFSNLLTLTTKPKAIADGLEKALSPLEKIKFPAHDFATMISIAFRFIPILTEEANKIMTAQKARGANFEKGSIIKRAKALMPILVPLFVSAFRRADELAQAMDSRFYGSGKATSLYPLKYDKNDLGFYLLILGYFLGVIALRMEGL
ncbi:MAG: energy-coupling factor transporter transmembrane protein EcfT [Sphaerochaetaceae bacterium]|nr:energy-coupling factor transporter transmembrane protein EcfT [Sphaerochaetaceae bacterium]